MIPLLLAATAVEPVLAIPYLSLHVTLQPEAHKLTGAARLRVNPLQPGQHVATLRLHGGLQVVRVTLNDRKVAYTRDGEKLLVTLPVARRAGGKWVLGVDYAGKPREVAGNLVRQDLGSGGALLHPEGRWFPEPLEAGPLVASVHAHLPAGWQVSAPAASLKAAPQRVFDLEFAKGQPLALAAGPFQSRGAEGVSGLFASASGADTLARGVKLAKLYAAHGLPVKLPRTLVELPAGFAALTVADWQAAPRPAALVQPGWQGAPWQTQGLAAFTADLLVERERGPAAYHQALRGHLAAYEAFRRRNPSADLPLGAAIAPTHPAFGPVVQDKGALLWSLIRAELGEQAFWDLLGRLSRGEAPPSFATLDRRLEFVQGWLTRPGLPRYKLEETRVSGSAGAWQVEGVLSQQEPWGGPVELGLVSEGQTERVAFQAFAGRMPFHFNSPTRPLRVVVDPAERLPLARLRQLWIGECLTAPGLVIAYGSGGTPAEAQAARETALALARKLAVGGKEPREPLVLADAALGPEQRRGPLALIGRPATNALIAAWQDQLPVRFVADGQALWWQGRTFQLPGQGAIQAIANPNAPEEPVVILSAISPAALKDALRFANRKATYCLFEGTRVLEEGEAMRTFPDLDAVLY